MILFVNACVRKNSRTLELARPILAKFPQDEIEEVNLEKEEILPLKRESLDFRSELVSKGDYSNEIFKYAKQFAKAEEIVIAAPFWDMSFPAILKIYFENVSVSGLTFYYNEQNEAVGLCKAKKITYVTTAGGKIYYNGGFEYVKGLCKNLFGIQKYEFVAKENLDV